MTEWVNVGLEVWFLRTMFFVMATSSAVSGTVAVICWSRRNTSDVMGILGRQYTVKALRSVLLGWVMISLPPTAAVTTLTGFQLAWMAVELWSAVTIWELGVWLTRRK